MAGGDILPHGKSRKANQTDTGKGKTAKPFAIADLHAPRRGDNDGLSGVPQRPAVDRPGVAESKAVVIFEIGYCLRRAMTLQIIRGGGDDHSRLTELASDKR